MNTSEGSDYVVGSVIRLEDSGEILGTKKKKVILDRNDFDFLVQMPVARRKAEIWIL